jgi:archaellum component FlaF (FlaF/FlaG flagellin family)
MIHEWMTTYEPEWLFTILFIETLAGFCTLYILIKEYNYDANKDLEKKQKRTRTTKKTTTQPTGTTVEETTEISEPVQDSITKGEMK